MHAAEVDSIIQKTKELCSQSEQLILRSEQLCSRADVLLQQLPYDAAELRSEAQRKEPQLRTD